MYPIYYTDKRGTIQKSKPNLNLIKILNRCKIYLKILIISDITDLKGKEIIPYFLHGKKIQIEATDEHGPTKQTYIHNIGPLGTKPSAKPYYTITPYHLNNH